MGARSFLFALAGIAAATGVVYLQERRSAAREREAMVAEVKAMIAASADRPPGMVREVIVASPSPATDLTAAAAPAPAIPAAVLPAEYRTRFEGVDPKSMPAEIEATFRSEAVDAAWARSTGGALRSYFSEAAVPGARVDSVECRSETCLVTARFEGPGDREAFLQRAFTPGSDSMYARANLGAYSPPPEPNGDVLEGKIYLFRESDAVRSH